MKTIQLTFTDPDSGGNSIQVDTILFPCVICAVSLTCAIYCGINAYISSCLSNRVTVIVLIGLSILVVSFDVCIIVYELVYSVLSIRSIPEIQGYS